MRVQTGNEAVSASPKVLIYDQACDTASGHHLPTDIALIAVLGDLCAGVVIEGRAPNSLEFGSGVTCFRLGLPRKKLADRIKIHAGLLKRSTYHERAEAKRLMMAISLSGIGSGDVLFAHTASIRVARGAMRLLEESGALPRFVMRFVVRGKINNRSERQEVKNAHLSIAQFANANPLLQIFTETEEMARYFQEEYGYESVSDWVLPISEYHRGDLQLKEFDGSNFVIGVLGQARDERGTQQVYDLARNVDKRTGSNSGTSFDFRVQQDRLANGESTMMSGASSIHAIGSYLEPDKYAEMLSTCHVLVLLHDQKIFALRGSGMVPDAILSGTPWISGAGLSMRNWRQAGGMPECTGIEGFADALTAMARDYRKYSMGAHKARELLIRHVGQRFAQLLQTVPSIAG